MRYTNSEMIFLNSLLDGENIFGLDIKKPFVADQEFIDETISSLKQKKLIDSDEHLTENIVRSINQLKAYKEASIHILYGTTRIALVDSENIVGIILEEKGYCFFTIKNYLFLHELFLNTPILNENMDNYVSGDIGNIDLEEYIILLEDKNWKDASLFRKYENRTLIEDYTFLWNSTTINFIDGLKNIQQKIDDKDFRLLLCELFEIKLDQEVA